MSFQIGVESVVEIIQHAKKSRVFITAPSMVITRL